PTAPPKRSPTGAASDGRWPLRFGSSTATPHTPGSLTSGATGRVADSAWRGELLGDVAATSRGGPEGEDARGRVGRLSGVPSRRDRPGTSPVLLPASSFHGPDPDRLPAPRREDDVQA